MISMPQDFKNNFKILDIFVILSHFEILSHYPNLESSTLFRDDVQ